jgi:molybdenum cofactor cytidylyltransferase
VRIAAAGPARRLRLHEPRAAWEIMIKLAVNPPSSHVVPVILAAGASTRMGRPKALCDFYGRSCLELALDACREARLAAPIVVLGFWAREIRAAVRLETATIRINDRPQGGQTSSLKVGLAGLPHRTEAFLLYPVDFPLLTAVDIQPLCVAWQMRRRERRIFIPSYGRQRGHPVLFDIALRDDCLHLDDGQPLDALADARANQVALVAHDTPYILMDMNTPVDYARCLAEFRRRAMGSPSRYQDDADGRESRWKLA